MRQTFSINHHACGSHLHTSVSDQQINNKKKIVQSPFCHIWSSVTSKSPMASVISCTQTLKWCLTWKVERFKKTGFQGLKCLQKTECRKNWVEEIKVGNLCISVLSRSPLLLQCNYFWPVEQTPLIFSITSSCLLPPQPAVVVHLSGKPAIIGCIVKSFAALCQRTDSNKLGRKGWWVEEGKN